MPNVFADAVILSFMTIIVVPFAGKATMCFCFGHVDGKKAFGGAVGAPGHGRNFAYHESFLLGEMVLLFVWRAFFARILMYYFWEN